MIYDRDTYKTLKRIKANVEDINSQVHKTPILADLNRLLHKHKESVERKHEEIQSNST